jgi:hypothetical protein
VSSGFVKVHGTLIFMARSLPLFKRSDGKGGYQINLNPPYGENSSRYFMFLRRCGLPILSIDAHRS